MEAFCGLGYEYLAGSVFEFFGHYCLEDFVVFGDSVGLRLKLKLIRVVGLEFIHNKLGVFLLAKVA